MAETVSKSKSDFQSPTLLIIRFLGSREGLLKNLNWNPWLPVCEESNRGPTGDSSNWAGCLTVWCCLRAAGLQG